jgi:hypothetical protein
MQAAKLKTCQCGNDAEIERARLVVDSLDGGDRMTLRVEVAGNVRRMWNRSSGESATSPSFAARSSFARRANCRTTAR